MTAIAVFAVCRASWPSARIATRGGSATRAAGVRSEPEEPPGPRREGLIAMGHDLAVHDHVVDPQRIAMRVVVRRHVDDRVRVEHHEIGPRALANDAAVAQPKPRRRE